MRHVLIACLLFWSLQATAQSQSAEDMKALIDKKVSELDSYQALLNDPDPKRALAAMEIMLLSDDTSIRRMALEYGIYSPDPAVNRAAIEAFLSSGPALQVSLDGSTAKDPKDFASLIGTIGGTTNDKMVGYVNLVVGEFNGEEKCYMSPRNGQCLMRVTDEGQSISLFGVWWPLKLGPDGALTGVGDMRKGNTGIMVKIPISL